MINLIKKINFKKIKLKKKKNPSIKIGLAHGVFDLLHFGHILHLKKAKENCDILVVSITSSRFVNKGPNRPKYNDKERLIFLSALSCVDYVYLSNEKTAEKIIKKLRPDYYFKGHEYQDQKNDYTKNIKKELNVLKSVSGSIRFTKEKTLSSSNIFNNFYSDNLLNLKSLENIKNKLSFNKLINSFQKISKYKVLVIGDIIVDRYFFCTSLGKSPKEDLISVKNVNQETYGGGGIATSNHISQFVQETTFLSSIGQSKYNKKYLKFIDNKIKKKIFYVSDEHTIEKNRFLEISSNRKLFQNLSNDFIRINTKIENKIIRYLNKNIKKFDIVIINDFGHGLLTKKIREIVQNKSKFLALNCQTNSSNVGYNFISKYKKADYVTIDEPEARLSTQKRFAPIEEVAKILTKQIKFKICSITRGEKGCIVFKSKANSFVYCPAVSKNVEDTVGAGDAYFAISSLISFIENNLSVIGFVGNVAGGIKISYLGHRQYIKKSFFLSYIKSLLS